MKEDYLWDRSGDADPEVERLETLLGRYRHDAPLRHERPPSRMWLAVAAALFFALVAGGTLLALRFRWSSGAAWDVTSVTGAPTIDGRVITANAQFALGEQLCTNAASKATVKIARIGVLDIAPSSCVRLVVTEEKQHRVFLARGSVAARVWAPPFTFAVRTPAGQANDIGCAFDLQYERGAGIVRVTSGWVDFDGVTRTALIPAGAISELREEPGTPFYPDANPGFIGALRRFDAAHDAASLHDLLRLARTRDAMTLLHLLDHSDIYPQWRGALFDRLSAIAPPPPGVTRADALRRDHERINAWRISLGLGGVKKWWLHWRDALPAKNGPAS